MTKINSLMLTFNDEKDGYITAVATQEYKGDIDQVIISTLAETIENYPDLRDEFVSLCKRFLSRRISDKYGSIPAVLDLN